MITITEPRQQPVRGFALFGYGFRPFFLGAGIQAVASVLPWVHAWHDGGMPAAIDLAWHAHETVFGFAAAALAGFLLTAVPNWTKAGPVRGVPLAALFALWVAGRLAAWLPPSQALTFAAIDIAFLPVLAAMVGPSVLRDAGRRSGILVAGLAALTVANALWHAEHMALVSFGATAAAQAGIAILAAMVTLVGGRIVPAFTIGGMRMAGRPVAIEPAPALDRVVLAATIVALALWVALRGEGTAVAMAAAAAGILQAVRLVRWQGWKTRGVALVWILHLASLWLVVGLGLVAAAAIGLVPGSAGVHALGGGAIGTMILAVMTRATLGHTGRPLHAGGATVAIYALVTAAAVARVVAAVAGVPELVPVAGLAWSAAFALFVAIYGPMQLRARPDGRPG